MRCEEEMHITNTDTTQALNRVWRQTGGRINDKLFHYEVGGEW